MGVSNSVALVVVLLVAAAMFTVQLGLVTASAAGICQYFSFNLIWCIYLILYINSLVLHCIACSCR